MARPPSYPTIQPNPQHAPPPMEPPPLPVEPIDYAKGSDPSARSIFHGLAHGSWLAALFAIILFVFPMYFARQASSGGAVKLLLIINIALIVLGMLAGVAALFGVRNRRGVMLPAIIGLTICSLLLAFAVEVAMRVQAKLATSKIVAVGAPPAPSVSSPAIPSPTVASPTIPPSPYAPPPSAPAPSAAAPSASVTIPPPPTAAADSAAAKKASAITDYPGWVGVNNRGDLVIAAAEWSDAAPETVGLKKGLAADCKIVLVTVDNRTDKALTFDPASLEFHFADYHTQKALPPMQIIAPPKTAGDAPAAVQVRQIAPHAQLVDGIAFFPAKTDLSTARAVTLTLGDQRYIIQGRYLTVAEKAVFFTPAQPKAKPGPSGPG